LTTPGLSHKIELAALCANHALTVNGGAQGTDFRPERTQPNPIMRFLGSKPGHFRAKWDAQKSVNYVSAAGINDARPLASAEAQAHAPENY
jgi:hypothetical protein